MKYLLPIIFLIAGLCLGYFFGVKSNLNNKNELLSLSNNSKPLIIHDTIVKNKIVKIKVKNDKQKVLAIDSAKVDTILIDTIGLTNNLLTINLDSVNDLNKFNTNLDSAEILNISRDKKVGSKMINIIYTNPIKEKDSLLKEVLHIKDVRNQQILIEFWESPINYRGYKMSKSKIIIYGLSHHFDYTLIANDTIYKLQFQNLSYTLKHTNSFLPLLKSN